MDGDKVAGAEKFEIWWWVPGEGNKYAIWNDWYYDPNDPEADEDGYVWLDEPSVWTDKSGDPILWKDKTFKAGEGFFTQPLAKNPQLTISGQVLPCEPIYAYYATTDLVSSQKRLIANPFPVPFALNTVIAYDGDKVAGAEKFEIWWWVPGEGNKYGIWNDWYYDPNDPEADEDGYVWLDEASVWTDKSGDPILWKDKTFGVGEGFFTQPLAKNPVLKFPNPFYKAPID